MHFRSFLTGLIISLLLAASVSATTSQRTYSEKLPPATDENETRCELDQLVQNSPKGSGRSPAGLNPDRVTLLNWNVYKGRRDDWVADFRRFSDEHDVVTIQEAHLGDELETLLDREHRHWTLNAAFDYQDRATGVMTASSVKPVHTCGQRTTEPLIRTPKTSLISYYPIQGVNEHLLVANIHGVNFTLGVRAYNEQIEKLYDAMKHHDGPVILAGDFNTWSDERMRIVEGLAQRLSLASLDYTNHNRTSVFGNALDHVFYRGLEPVDHDTWHVTSSDHNPTRVSFRLNSYYLAGGSEASEIDENNC